MNKIHIEWMYYDKEGETCTRCKDTGNNIRAALQTISKDKDLKNLTIKYSEAKLQANQMPDSNTVLINGQKIEDVLGAASSENYCHSCTCLAGTTGSSCRTIVRDGESYEAIPEEMILEAIMELAKD